MSTQLGRTLRIFILAAGLFTDYRRIRRMDRKSNGPDRTQRLTAAYSRAGSRVRNAAFDLQGLIVKVGQFLSARTDVLPTAFTSELKQLQDEVPAAPFAPVRTALEVDLGRALTDTFRTFDPVPIASASLGQVYHAQLADGTDVAVKVLRPGIERLARIDLSALRKVVWLLNRFTRFGRRMNVWRLYQEFAAMVAEELDYRHELDNLRRFAETMASDTRIVVPGVFEEVSTGRVLVMTYMRGAKVTDPAQLTDWDVEPATIVPILLDSYLRQVLETGLIHVDPHPGNLLVLPDGRLCFLDFGMMTDLPKADARAFARLVQSLLVHDLATAVRAIDDLGFLQPHANRTFLERALGFMLDRFNGVELHAGPELDDFLDDFNGFLREEPIQIPAKYMFLGRALGMVIGLINTLAPEMQWGPLLRERALPFVARLSDPGVETAKWLRPIVDWVGSTFGTAAAEGVKLVMNQASEFGRIGLRLPGRLDHTLDQLENGRLQVRLDLDEVLRRFDRQQQLFTRLTWLGFSIAAGLAAAWLQNHHWGWQADLAWGLTGVGIVVWFGDWLRGDGDRWAPNRRAAVGQDRRARHGGSAGARHKGPGSRDDGVRTAHRDQTRENDERVSQGQKTPPRVPDEHRGAKVSLDNSGSTSAETFGPKSVSNPSNQDPNS